jgi:hypothetical protein
MKVSPQTLFAVGASIVVAAVIAVGLFLNGNPAEVRRQRLDEQRISDLQSLSSAINGHFETQRRLPASLAELDRRLQWRYVRDRDPATGQPYEYRATGEQSYQLCATFETEGNFTGYGLASVGFRPGITTEQYLPQTWDHGAGRNCFPFDVTPNPAPTR